EELLSMEHDADVARRDELINERTLEGGHETVLNQLLVAERLLELPAFHLEIIDIVDVHVSVLDPRLPLAEVGQHAKFVILEHVGLDAEARAPEQEVVDIDQVLIVDKGPVVRLELSGN